MPALRAAWVAPARGPVAQADDGFDTFGQVTVTDREHTHQAAELAELAVSEHGHAIVVVLTPATRPGGGHGPHQGAQTTEENA